MSQQTTTAPQKPKTFEEILSEVRGGAPAAPTEPSTAAPSEPKRAAPVEGAKTFEQILSEIKIRPAEQKSEAAPDRQNDYITGAVEADKTDVIVSDKISKYLDKSSTGSPILYMVPTKGGKTAVNLSRIRSRMRKTKRDEKMKRFNRKWSDLPDSVKEDLNAVIERQIDREINSWIDEQRDTTTHWLKSDPQEEADKLVQAAKDSLLRRATAPIEAVLWPQTTEIITKTNVGKTYNQLNDFEGVLGSLSYLGRFAPTTLVYSAIANGGYGTEGQIRDVLAGKDGLSYSKDLGGYVTGILQNAGIVSEETAKNPYVNAVVGGVPIFASMLFEPDIYSLALGGIGLATGGPAGAAGGYLSGKGAKGLKAFRVISKINSREKALKKIQKTLEDVADGTDAEKLKAVDAINKEAKRAVGGLFERGLANHLLGGQSTRLTGQALDGASSKAQAIRAKYAKAGKEDVIDEIAKLNEQTKDGGTLLFTRTGKLRRTKTGKEGLARIAELVQKDPELADFIFSKAVAEQLLKKELESAQKYAKGVSDLRARQVSKPEMKAAIDDLAKHYDEYEDIAKRLNKAPADEQATLFKQLESAKNKLLDSQQKYTRLYGDQLADVAVNRFKQATRVSDASRKLADHVAKSISGVDEIPENVKNYRAAAREVERYTNEVDGAVYYRAATDTVDAMLKSLDSLKENIRMKKKVFDTDAVDDALLSMSGVKTGDNIRKVLDETLGSTEMAQYLDKSPIGQKLDSLLKSKSIDMEDENTLRFIRSAVEDVPRFLNKQKKEDLGIVLGEQVLENYDFIENATSLLGSGFIQKSVRAMRNTYKDFKRPGVKAYGATAEGVENTFRGFQSAAKRGIFEVGEIVRGVKAPDPGRVKALQDEIQQVLTDTLEGEIPSYFRIGKETSEQAIARIKNLSEKKLERFIQKTALKESRTKALRDFITTNKPINTSIGATMANRGTTTLFSQAISNWIRESKNLSKAAVADLENVSPTFHAFIRSFLMDGESAGVNAKAYNAAKKAAIKAITENKDLSYDALEEAIIKRVVGATNGKVVPSTGVRDQGFRATHIMISAMEDRARYDLLRRMGGVDANVASDIQKLVSGNLRGVKDMRAALNALQDYGLPLSRQSFDGAAKGLTTVLEAAKLDDGVVLVPKALKDLTKKHLDGMVKELDQFNSSEEARNFFANAVTGAIRAWRTSIVTGLILPNPRHFVNIFFGNFSQIWGEVNFSTAAKVQAQSLSGLNIPWLSNKLREAHQKSVEKYGNRALGSTTNALHNPWVNAFYDVSRVPDSTKLPSHFNGVRTMGDLRRGARDNGVLSTFIGTDIREAMSKAAFSEKDGLKRKVWNSYIKGEAYQNFAETIEQRQRIGLFMELVTNKGMRPQQAADVVKKALYDWDAPLTKFEADVLNKYFLFWRFWKLSLGQAARHLTDPLVRPPNKTTDLLKYSAMQRNPIARFRAQYQLATAIPEQTFMAQQPQDLNEDGVISEEEETLYLQSMVYPWYKSGGSRVFLTNYPSDSTVTEEYLKLKGQELTHEAVSMPAMTLLDTYGFLWSTFGGMLGSAASVTTEEDPLNALPNMLEGFVLDPLDKLAHPAVKPGIDFARETFTGKKTSFGSSNYKKLNLTEQAIARALMLDGYLVRRTKGKFKDPEGVVRAPKAAVNVLRATPFLGTQMSRFFEPFFELEAEKRGMAGAIAYLVRRISGIADIKRHSPQKQLEYLAKDLEEEAKREASKSKFESVD